MNISPAVIKHKKEYVDSVRKWELYKGNRDAVVMKKDMLKSIGFNRKVDSDVTENT